MPRINIILIDSLSLRRLRPGEEQLIADLQAKIEQIKSRAASKAAAKDATFRYVSMAIKSIDAAMASTGDQALRSALQEARATLSACMQLKGVPMSRHGRSNGLVDSDAVLAFVQKNPGQRSERIAAGLGTDSKAFRSPMKRLVEAGQVRTKGERRGMQYWAG